MEWNRTLWSERAKTVIQILVIRQRRFLSHMELEQTQTDNKKISKSSRESRKKDDEKVDQRINGEGK